MGLQLFLAALTTISLSTGVGALLAPHAATYFEGAADVDCDARADARVDAHTSARARRGHGASGDVSFRAASASAPDEACEAPPKVPRASSWRRDRADEDCEDEEDARDADADRDGGAGERRSRAEVRAEAHVGARGRV